MTSPVDQKTTAIKKIVIKLKITRNTPCHGGPHKEIPRLVRRQREQGENISKRFYCDFHVKKQARQNWLV